MTQKTLMWQLENEREKPEEATAGLRSGPAGVGIFRALVAILLIYGLGFLAVFAVRGCH